MCRCTESNHSSPLGEVHAPGVFGQGRSLAGLRQGHPEEPDERVQAKVSQARHAGNRVLEQRLAVRLQQERARPWAVTARLRPQ